MKLIAFVVVITAFLRISSDNSAEAIELPKLPISIPDIDTSIIPTDIIPFITEVPNPSVFINATSSFVKSLSKGWQDLIAGYVTWAQNQYSWQTNKLENTAVCKACDVGVSIAIVYVKLGFSDDVLQAAIAGLCAAGSSYSYETCSGLVNMFAPELFYIIRNKHITAFECCGIVLQDYDCNRLIHRWPPLQWSVDADVGTAPTEQRSPSNRTGQIKILHLADVHYDPEYHVGYSKECNEPICCRESNGPTDDTDKQAGYWGEYDKCDVPYHTVVNILDHIKQTHNDIDLVILTGDLPPHNVWDTSKAQSLSVLANISKTIDNYLGGIKITPVLGNHESHPTNTFPLQRLNNTRFQIQWLYDAAADAWFPWLPEDALATVRRAGCYSYSPIPGLRVLSINSNMCYTLNFWLLYDSKDPEQVLKWVAEELLAAEENGEWVYLMGHVPPGNSDCWSVWSRGYAGLVKRFQSIIKGQFYSHTHQDEFKVFVDDNEEAYGNMYLGGSITTFENLNPSYRIYTASADNYEIQDFETWTYNLTEANAGKGQTDPVWYKSYSAKSQFDLEDMSPEEWHKLGHRLKDNDTAFTRYRQAYWRDATPGIESSCDYTCRRMMICNALTTNWAEKREC